MEKEVKKKEKSEKQGKRRENEMEVKSKKEMEKEMENGMEKEKNEKKKKESSRLTAAVPDSRKAPHPTAPDAPRQNCKSKRFGPEITSAPSST